MKRTLLSLAFLSLTSLGFAQTTRDFTRVQALIKEAKEKGNVKSADSMANDYIDNYLFKLKKEEIFTKDNLKFMGEFLNSPHSKAFNFFMRNRKKINKVLTGLDQAEYPLRKAIAAAYLPKTSTWEDEMPDWEALEKNITAKFGALGQEEVYGNRMGYAAKLNDWDSFGKYYMLYFKQALIRPEGDINQLSWNVVEKVNDPNVVSYACEVVNYAIKHWDQSAEILDTYANLLHKAGKTSQAIKWEEKAVEMKKGQSDEKLYTDALDKMKKGIPSWTVSANN